MGFMRHSVKARQGVARRRQALVLAAAIAWPGAAGATDFVWTNGGGTNVFNTAANWSPAGGPPNDAADKAIFNGTEPGSSTFTATFTGSLVNDQFVLSAPSGVLTLDLKGFTYTVGHFGSAFVVGNTAGGNVGLALTSTAAAPGTVHSSDDVEVGAVAAATGALTVGANARLEFDRLLVGESGGAGRLDIVNGGAAVPAGTSGGNTFIGVGKDSVGVFNISGSQSVFQHDDLFVGVGASTGTMTVSGGATVTGGFRSIIGSGDVNGSGNGTATVTGAGTSWDARSLQVGSFGGTGSLTVSGGASIISSTSDIGKDDANVPSATPSVGAVTVTGAGSNWRSTFGISVGDHGSGTLNITSGASVDSDVGGSTNSTQGSSVAASPGSTGAVTLSGTGSEWNSLRQFSIGGNGTAAGGAGTVTVGTGATLTAGSTSAHTLRVWGPGTLNLSGGTVVARNFIVDGGTFNWTGGTLVVHDAMTLGPGATGSGLVLSGGKTLRVTGGLSVGEGVPLTVSGGDVSAASLSNAGTVSVEGAGTNQSFPSITNQPRGLLRVSGAALTAPGGISNSGEVRLEGGAAQVSGGTLNNSGLVTGDGRIGASLVNNAAGTVRATAGQRLTFTGADNTSAGTVHVQGGAADFTAGLRNSGQLDVIDGQVTVGGAATNDAGAFIGGRNTTLRFAGGLTNSGTLGTTFGTSDVFGRVTNAAGGKTIVSGNSNVTFYDAVTNAPGSEFRVSAGSAAAFFGPVTGGAAFTGSGAKFFEAGTSALAAVQTAGSTTVEAPAQVTATRFRESALTVNGSVSIAPGGGAAGTSAVDTLAVSGSLDLADHAIVVRSGDLVALTRAVKQGLAGGGGLTTSLRDNSHAIGIIANGSAGVPIYGSFEGVGALTGGEVLARFTLLGDADLDGTVGADDLARARASLGGGGGWLEGDFNYDGRVNARDIALLRRNLGLSLTPAASIASSPQAVPEPATAGLLLLAGAVSLRRRRRGNVDR
jgi:T5SS/PEP-CTERM-associated repeat protein